MDFFNINKKGKIIRTFLLSYMSIGIIFLILSVLFNINWAFITITIFFSFMGINIATLNEQESLPKSSDEAANMVLLSLFSGGIGFIIGFIFLLLTFLDPQTPLFIIVAFGFFILGIGGFICIKRNLTLFKKLQGIKVEK